MFGSYRRLVLAGLGGLAALLAIGAASEFAAVRIDSPSGYPEYRETAEEAQKRLPTLTLQDALKRPVEQQPCRNPQGHDASDLCAQWRAADAAERASRWSWWQMILSGFAVVGLAITLWFNLEAWRLARESQADTDAALGQAQKSAEAMKAVAETLQGQATFVAQNTETNRQIADAQQKFATLQLRAYLSVKIGAAIYQDRAKGLRFEARPSIINGGNTAAKSLTHRIKAEILPMPLPDGYEFVDAPIAGKGGFIPPHDDRTMRAIVDDLIDDASVVPVMSNLGRALYVWGKITYLDEFDIERETTFGQSLLWIFRKDDEPFLMGTYIPGMNHAT